LSTPRLAANAFLSLKKSKKSQASPEMRDSWSKFAAVLANCLNCLASIFVHQRRHIIWDEKKLSLKVPFKVVNRGTFSNSSKFVSICCKFFLGRREQKKKGFFYAISGHRVISAFEYALDIWQI
jgi:hypothetical protein